MFTAVRQPTTANASTQPFRAIWRVCVQCFSCPQKLWINAGTADKIAINPSHINALLALPINGAAPLLAMKSTSYGMHVTWMTNGEWRCCQWLRARPVGASAPSFSTRGRAWPEGVPRPFVRRRNSTSRGRANDKMPALYVANAHRGKSFYIVSSLWITLCTNGHKCVRKTMNQLLAKTS